MTTEYQVAYAEGYEAGAQELHKRDAALAQCRSLLKQQVEDVTPLRERVAVLEASMRRYGQHMSDCHGLLYHGRHHPYGDCSCGFNQAAIDCGLRHASQSHDAAGDVK